MSTETSTTLEHAAMVPQAAKDIFNATCGVEVQEVDDSADLGHDGVIVALISLVGDVDWAVFLGLPRDTAVAAAGKFAGFEIPFDSEDMGDAIGELTNIFAGQIKALLDSRGVQADISLPSVMRADSIEVLIQKDSGIKRQCFSSEVGMFWTGLMTGKMAGLG